MTFVNFFVKSYTIFLLLVLANMANSDLPCVPRKYDKDSIVCVCTADYCDEISKIQPLPVGQYVLYSSSMDGQRFNKTEGTLGPLNLKHKFSLLGLLNQVTIDIDRSTTYQTVTGFGGAFTDAAGINILKLSKVTQDKLLNSYFSENGLEYNMGRVPIGGCDFSTHKYAYNMYPEKDVQLTNFSLTEEDLVYKIPLIKRAQSLATDEIFLTSAAWSPPPWMKTNNDWTGLSALRTEYYQTWADYHYKFLEEYKKHDIKIWAVSTGNEPIDGIVPFVVTFNSLGWVPKNQAKWLAENLGPTLKNSNFSDVKILALDDQRFNLPMWIEVMALVHPKCLNYMDGIALHWYANAVVTPWVLDLTHFKYPSKFLLATEASRGFIPYFVEDVNLGSWGRAESYIENILEDLNHWVVGWIDWNLALNREGGPNWNKNFVDSAIIVFPENNEFVKQPIFYAMGHFSKFIPRGSVRIDTDMGITQLRHAVFLRPDSGMTVVFYNPNDIDKTLLIRDKTKGSLLIPVKGRSVHTLVYY